MPRKRKRSSWGSEPELVRPGVYRIRYTADAGDGRGKTRRSETVYGTRRQADQRRNELRLLYERQAGKPSTPTVSEVWARWVCPELKDDVASGKMSVNYSRSFMSVWRKHVEPRWGKVMATAVKAIDVKEWLDGKSGQTAVMCKVVLKRVMNTCLMYEVVERNVMEVKMRIKEEKPKEKDIFRVGELEAVARAVKGNAIEGAFILAQFGSCRVGESLGVRASEVSYAEVAVDGYGTVPVARAPIVRQVDNATGEPVERLKNAQSRRHVVVAGPMGARLWEVAQGAVARGDAWLCDRGDGRPMNQRGLNKLWGNALADAGIRRVSFHSLRNGWLTLVRWEMGYDRGMYERMMGHSVAGVTEKYYDQSSVEEFTRYSAEAYARRPYADAWNV